MTEELKTQWHPAFVSAMQLELMADAEYLNYTSEYSLNTKPLAMDLLIVKKNKEIEIKNEIGKLFRAHNIIEYKSPKDAMNVSTFLKVIAYACLYKTYEEHVDDIKLDDITITLVRETKPHKLFHWLEENGYYILEKYKGIFYVSKEGSFPIQFLVSKHLARENQKWLTLLSSNLDRADAERVVAQIEALTGENEKRFVDSVLQVAMKENKEVFGRLKEERNMCQALREFFEPELKEALEENTKQNRRDMILNAIKNGSSAQEISRVMGIPLTEVEIVEKQMAEMV